MLYFPCRDKEAKGDQHELPMDLANDVSKRWDGVEVMKYLLLIGLLQATTFAWCDCAVVCGDINWGATQGVIHISGGNGTLATDCYAGIDSAMPWIAVHNCHLGCVSCTVNFGTCPHPGWDGTIDCVSPNGAGSSCGADTCDSSANKTGQFCGSSADCPNGGTCCTGQCFSPGCHPTNGCN